MSIVTPKVKICGLKSPEKAFKAAQLGADFIGIIAHKPSKRYVDIDTAREISEASIGGGATPVLVCVDQTAHEIASLCDLLNINTVQLHGSISRAQHHLLPAHLKRIFVLHVNAAGDIINQVNDIDHNRDYLLFDALEGGSGKTIITDNIKRVANGYRYFVAGGLSVDNIASVIDQVKPYGVDLSSGVENAPGNKNLNKIESVLTQSKGCIK